MASAELNVDIDVDGAWKLKKLIQDLKKASRQAKEIKLADVGKAMQARAKSLGKELTDQTRIHKRHFDSVDKMAAMSGKMIHKFIGMAAKFAAIQVAALGAGLLLVHAAFVVGQATMKAYNYLLKAGAGAMGALTVAASIAAAAIREHQAAMYAYKGTNMSEFGKGINQIRVQMRMMQTDSQLATIGAEGLNAALAEIYKTGTYGGGSQKMLKSLMDFGAAGQDVAKGAAAAGKLIATIQDPKANFSAMKKAAEELGPAMKQALEKLNITTKNGLIEAINDGTLAAAGGVKGQFDAVSGTLISQFKRFKVQAVAMFADFGQPFLAPAKKAIDDILFSFKRTFVRISGALSIFGQDSFFSGLTSAITKLEDFFVKFINNHLPKAEGLFSNLSASIKDFKYSFDGILNKLRPLIEGARVLEKMFGNIFRIVGKELADGFGRTNELFIKNRATVEEFGAKIGNFITVLMKFGSTLRDIFFEALPFINKIIDGVTFLLDAVFSLMGGMRSMLGGGSFGAFTMLAGAIAGGKSLKNTIGGTLSKAIPIQNIKANVVNVSGGVVNGNPMHGMTAGGQTTAAAVRNANALGQTGGMNAAAGGGGAAAESSSSHSQSFSNSLNYSRKAVSDQNKIKADRAAERKARSGDSSGSRSQQGGGGVADAAYGPMGPTGTGMYGPYGSPMSEDGSGSKSRAHPAARRHEKLDLDRRARGINQAKGYRDSMPTMKLMEDIKSGKVAPRTHAEFAMQDQEFKTGADGKMLFDDNGRPIMAYTKGGRKRNVRRPGYTTANLSDAPGDTFSKDTKTGRFGTSFRNAREKYFRQPRTTQRYASMFGDGKNYKGKFTGTGASMGAMMGLGMASQYAPKEMQGSLALGSSLAAINPLLGVGVGLVGAGMNANNAVAGVGLGMAGGAALGAKFGPYGALIGAAAGGIFAGVGGWWKRNKKRKQEAKEVGRDMAQQASDAMFEGMSNTLRYIGTVGLTSANIKKTIENASKPVVDLQNSVNNALAYVEKNGQKDFKAELQRQFDTKSGPFSAFLPDQSAVDKATGDPLGFLNSITAANEENSKVQTYMTDKYTDKIQKLSKALGKSEKDIISLAKETNTNLFDVRQSFAETVASITKGLARTESEINAKFADSQGASLDRFRILEEQDLAPAILEEIGRSLYEKGQTGPLSLADSAGIMDELTAGFNQFYGGNVVQASMSMIEQLNPDTGLAYEQENSYFSNPNVKAAFTNGNFAEAFRLFTSETLAAIGQAPMDQLNAALGSLDSGALEGQGAAFESMPEAFTKLAQLDPGKYFQLQEFLDPNKNSSLREGKGINELTGLDIQTVIGKLLPRELLPDLPEFDKVSIEATNVEADLKKLGLNAATAAVALTALTTLLNQITGVTPDTVSDTASPRGDTASSRFNATFMKHQALSSMVTGKRQITSGVRNFNLGSINSDHVTGGALDLVGQNLGQYKSAVEANGGFAEFHGVNASRHLHVVPNARATGDSPTAVSVGSVRQDGNAIGGSTNNYSININGYNKSPQQLAAEVLALIKSNERSITERK